MKDYKVYDKDGKRIDILNLGMFKIPDLEKEFIMYGLADNDSNNENGHILLGEVIIEDDTMKIVGIEPNEKDIVMAYYNELASQLGGVNNG